MDKRALISFIIITLLKLLLLPSYRSTDFEVHRNWLAITHSLPLNQWYTHEGSEWTLDYPPFFAYFEYGLSHIAKFFDPNMLDVTNLNYSSTETIVFQRLSVIVSDIILFLGISSFCKGWNDRIKAFIIISLTLFNGGLLLIDHIHFQYNGMLFGILLLSISAIVHFQYLLGAFYFSVLLNFKHIFLYIAPVYFIYLLRKYCVNKKATLINKLNFLNLIKLGVVVLIPFIISFGPFIYLEQIHQVISRLFPFKRGLVHSYWAPNFWSLYTFADVVLGRFFGLQSVHKSTIGVVGLSETNILPIITPKITFILTILSILPCLYYLWKEASPKAFIHSIVVVSLSSFMFGWHVHEKAILISLIPLGLLSTENGHYSKYYVLLSFIGVYSLHPLLYRPIDFFIKLTLIVFNVTFSVILLSGQSKIMTHPKKIEFNFIERLCFPCMALLFIYTELLHPIFFYQRYEFLPLMLTSVSCAIGVFYIWIRLYRMFKRMNK